MMTDLLGDEALKHPINSLESEEDMECSWRKFVNECLKGDYQTLFERLDQLVMLKAPSMQCSFEWRQLQEKKLEQKMQSKGLSDKAETIGIMTNKQIVRFIQHYERLTIHNFGEIPQRANWVFYLDENHEIYKHETHES